MKKISILIPCHNSVRTLRRTWDSVKAQTMNIRDLEVIFIDDASDDDGATRAMLQDIESEAPESVLLIMLDENLRQGGARNVGLQYVSGEYVLFLDSDDTLRKETCQELYSLASEYKAELIQFQHRNIADDKELKNIPANAPVKGDIRLYDLADEQNRKSLLTMGMATAGCSNKLYSSDLLARCGSSYAEKVFYEEPKFVYPLFLYASRIIITDKDYYEYHWHLGSTMTSKLGIHLMDHPQVQLEMMEDLMGREAYTAYSEEIDLYFFFSFYIETLMFAQTNKGEIDPGQLRSLQDICRTVIPHIATNVYVNKSEDMIWAAATIENGYDDAGAIKTLEAEMAKRFA